MTATIDSVGRVVVPEPLRDELGLAPGTEVDISRYGAGLHLVVGGLTGRIVEEDGLPVVTGSTPFGDDEMFAVIDDLRP